MAKETKDFVKEMKGNFTLAKAEDMFGKAKAMDVYKAVANAGGYGFDGSTPTLAVPSSNKALAENINSALAEVSK